MRYPNTLTTPSGVTLGCTDPQASPVIAGDRFTPRPTSGDVLTAADGSRYLLLDFDAVVAHSITKYYKLGLVKLTHTAELQRLTDDQYVTYATIPCHLHRSTTTEEHSPDRSHNITRRELWLPYSPDVKRNDRVIIGGEPYQVIGKEHLPTISRLIIKTDRR